MELRSVPGMIVPGDYPGQEGDGGKEPGGMICLPTKDYLVLLDLFTAMHAWRSGGSGEGAAAPEALLRAYGKAERHYWGGEA